LFPKVHKKKYVLTVEGIRTRRKLFRMSHSVAAQLELQSLWFLVYLKMLSIWGLCTYTDFSRILLRQSEDQMYSTCKRDYMLTETLSVHRARKLYPGKYFRYRDGKQSFEFDYQIRHFLDRNVVP